MKSEERVKLEAISMRALKLGTGVNNLRRTTLKNHCRCGR